MRKMVLCLLLLAALSLPGRCVGVAAAVPAGYTSKTKVAMGYFATISRLCVFDDFSRPGAVVRFEDTWAKVKAILERVELAASVSLPESDIARFNALAYGASVAVGAETVELVEIARRMSQATDGYFDPTVAPLVDLWGFSPRFTTDREPRTPYDRVWADGALPAPDARYLDAFRQLVGMDGVLVEGDAETGYRLTKAAKPVVVDGVTYQAQLDLGGIAKGYACDLVTALLDAEGYEYGYFSSGSSSIRLLRNASFSAKDADDPSFELEVRKPRQTGTPGDAFATVRVMDQSLSSSGDYGVGYRLDGDMCCHIIDPFTGYPMNVPSGGVQQGVSAVTLLSASATEDEAYTTALCLMGPQEAVRFVNEHLRGQDVILVFYRADQPFYEVVTNMAPDRLTMLDPAYVLASEVGLGGEMRYTGTLFALPAS